MERIKLTKEGLRKDIQELGLSRKEMADKYGLPVTQMNIACKKAGLAGMKPIKQMFEFVDEEVKDAEETPKNQLALDLEEEGK